MPLLLVEDDLQLGKSLLRALNDAGMMVDWIKDGTKGEIAIYSGSYSLVLLDLGLPSKSGLAVLKSIREAGNKTPVFIITARDKIDELESGLDTGGDDYIIKPFSLNVLLARIQRVLRRNGKDRMSVLSNGEIAIDLISYKASYRGITQLLSTRELALLQALLEHPGLILSRTQLETHLYGVQEEVESNVIEVLIHALRKKFDCEIIRNVRGIGWMVINHTLCSL